MLHIRNVRRPLAVGITLLVFTLAAPRALAQATTASAGPPFGMEALTYQRMLAQIPLDDAANQIHTVAASPGASHDGLLQTAVDVDHHVLTVYWHGPVPADIKTLVADLRRSVDVRIVPTR